MKLLLDTHIWIWAVSHPRKLAPEIRRRLESPKNELYLSAISVWEAGYLSRGPRLRLEPSFPEWLRDVRGRVPIQEVPVDFAVALEAAAIRLPQNDLGDKFLAATALVHDLTLVTSDEQLLSANWLKTLRAG